MKGITDTNTTYSAGTGVTLTGTTFSIGQNVATNSTVTFYHGHFTYCNCSHAYFNRMYGATYFNQNVFLAFGLPNGDTRFFYTENGGSNYALITSDDRLKFNETTLTNGISIINKLNPVLYDKMPYDPTEEIDFLPYDPSLSHIEAGFIAQELLNIPELKDSVFSGKDPTKHAYMMNYNFILAYNVKATQELDAIVQNQQTVINEQNTRIQELEAENTTIKNALNQLLSDAGKPTI